MFNRLLGFLHPAAGTPGDVVIIKQTIAKCNYSCHNAHVTGIRSPDLSNPFKSICLSDEIQPIGWSMPIYINKACNSLDC